MSNIHKYLPLILLKTLFFNAYGEYQYITVEGTHTSTIPNAIEEGSQYRISFELDLNTVGEALVGDDADFGQNFLGYDYVFKNSVKNFSYTSAFSTLESSSDLNLYLKIDSTNRIRVGIFYYPQAISIHGGVLSTIGLKGEKSDAPLSAYVLGDSLNDYFTASNFNFVSIFHDTYAYWTTAFLNTAGSTAYFNTMPIDSIYEGTIATELPTIQLKMEESTDLNSWTEIDGAATMTVPVPSGTDTKFFRFKMAE